MDTQRGILQHAAVATSAGQSPFFPAASYSESIGPGGVSQPGWPFPQSAAYTQPGPSYVNAPQQRDGNSVNGPVRDLPHNFMSAPPQFQQNSYNFPGPYSGHNERNFNGGPVVSTPWDAASQYWQQQHQLDLAQQRSYQQQAFLQQQQYGQQHQLPPRALWPQDISSPATSPFSFSHGGSWPWLTYSHARQYACGAHTSRTRRALGRAAQ